MTTPKKIVGRPELNNWTDDKKFWRCFDLSGCKTWTWSRLCLRELTSHFLLPTKQKTKMRTLSSTMPAIKLALGQDYKYSFSSLTLCIKKKIQGGSRRHSNGFKREKRKKSLEAGISSLPACMRENGHVYNIFHVNCFVLWLLTPLYIHALAASFQRDHGSDDWGVEEGRLLKRRRRKGRRQGWTLRVNGEWYGYFKVLWLRSPQRKIDRSLNIQFSINALATQSI